jgi:thioredoxin reductase
MPEASSSSADQARIEVDVALVGAGPVGLYGAYCAGFRGLTTAVIDALPAVGGQVSAMYPEKLVYDVAGFSAVRGRDLVKGLTEQADRYGSQYVLGHSAKELVHVDGRLEIVTDQKLTVSARAVVVTGGIGSFSPRTLPAAEGYEGKGLVYFVPRLASCEGKDVVIVGGGDSAFDWAQAIVPLARSVTLVHRRSRFRAHAATVAAVQESTARVIVDATVSKVAGAESIEQVVVSSVDGSAEEVIPCQVLVAALGFTADLGPLQTWGLQIEDRHIRVDSSMQTGASGVYAAGDITSYPGKVRLMSVGFGEVATAVNNAAVALDPDAELFPGHSSDREAEPCRT